MSKETHSIDVSDDTWKQLQELRELGEPMSETIERLIENAQGERVLFSKFTVIAMIGALSWLLSFGLAGETVSNAIGGAFIGLTLLWISWRELAFRGLVGSSTE